MDTLKKIEIEAAIIVDAAAQIEYEFNHMLNDMSAADWRVALGVVENASRKTYRLKKQMLDSAIQHWHAHGEATNT